MQLHKIINQSKPDKNMKFNLKFLRDKATLSSGNQQAISNQAIMRINTTFIVLLIAFSQVSAAGFAQKVSISKSNITFSDLFREIKSQTGYHFLFRTEDLKGGKALNINVYNVELKRVLDQIILPRGLMYSIDQKTIIIQKQEKTVFDKLVDYFNEIDVKGVVLDEKGTPLSGANVKVKGTNQSVVTNEKGEFKLQNVDENEVLVFTYIGYLQEEKKVQRSPIKVVLTPSASDLTEVNVKANTGYQLLPKERATGAIDVVTSKQIQNKIQTNVLERLEGLVPGLMMINGVDNGSDDGLTIRGVSTLSGTKRPLIVVDNFPIEGDINTINPNDVETITVLKDAAAASIWGARAANGVIVITTKHGKKGDISFTYTNSFQFQPKPNLDYFNRATAAEDIAIEKQLLDPGYTEAYFRNTGYSYSKVTQLYMDSVAGRISAADYAAGLQQLSGLDNTQQIKDLLMQNPFTMNQSLSFSGGDDKNTYYGSLNVTNSNGYDLKDADNVYNALFKSTHKIGKRLTLGINVNLNTTNGTGAPVSSIDVYKTKAYNMLEDANGNPLPISMDGYANPAIAAQRAAYGLGDLAFYPLLAVDQTEITNRSTAQRFQAELNYKIVDGISFNASYQLEKANSYNKVYTHADESRLMTTVTSYITPTYTTNGVIATNADGTLLNPTYNIPQGGKLEETRTDNSAYTLRGVLNVDKTIASDHQISAVIGFEQRRVWGTGSFLTKYGYDDNTLKFIELDKQKLASFSTRLDPYDSSYLIAPADYITYVEDRYISMFGNAAYSFKKKYVLSGSFRIDQTNLFGTDPQYLYKPMWSSGVSWIISNEDFLKDSKLVNYLQARATYGLNGNIPKNSGPFLIATASVNSNTNLPAYTISSPENDALRWEKTEVTNFGLDFGLFKNRISGKLDYYLRRSSDLLAETAINPTLGFYTALLNTASMNNDGFELQLTTRNIVNKNFRWTTNFTYARNNNKITEVSLSSSYTSSRVLASSSSHPYIVGYPYGGLFSVRYGGLTPDNGQLYLLDANGQVQGDYLTNALDFAYYSGNSRPVTSGAFGNIFNYKNFELSFMFQFYLGHVGRQNLPNSDVNGTAYDSRVATAWKAPGDELTTTIPNVVWDSQNYYYARAYYSNYLDVQVFDASYAKLREVILTYNFSPKSLARFKFIKGLQINAQARNLWTITANKLGIDPEAFSNGVRTTPVSPTFAFGVNLNF
ncbi:SusC/RagA family TonB-linked outer membrane protein [Pedobacter sp. AW1-32]|uniref:SusC/RagA family TonB-linked outer membrane protein n=1 Tax=Pedobacter sp. AW1-32 TaxID=3383026 RepID=UPI003FEE81FC